MSLKFEFLDFNGLIGSDDPGHILRSAAKLAQVKFDKWLSEQPFVYGFESQDIWEHANNGHTVRARIVAAEGISKKNCEHRNVLCEDPRMGNTGKCLLCGANLVHKWVVVE